MLIEVNRSEQQQIPVIQTGVASGYRWTVEVYSLRDPSHMEVRVFAPRLMRRQAEKYEHPLHSMAIQWDLPPRRATAHANSVYVLETDVRSLRVPLYGWFEVEYASRRIRASPKLVTAENSDWGVSSGLWHSPFSGRQVKTDWAGAFNNMQAAADHVCCELRKIEEVEC